MPVLLEQIHKPNEADWIDLEKIHNDTAPDGLKFNPQQLRHFLDQDGWVLAGRFNDRIIGVILAQKTAQGIKLSQAGVRTITQRRGVMHQLLHFIRQWAKENQLALIIDHCPAHLQNALLKRGFHQQGEQLFHP